MSLSNLGPSPGRYAGDLRTTVQYSPAAKKPYRVVVHVWVRVILPGSGEWTPASSLFDNYSRFRVNNYFRTLEKALAFRAEAQTAADLGYFSKQVHSELEASWTDLS